MQGENTIFIVYRLKQTPDALEKVKYGWGNMPFTNTSKGEYGTYLFHRLCQDLHYHPQDVGEYVHRRSGLFAGFQYPDYTNPFLCTFLRLIGK